MSDNSAIDAVFGQGRRNRPELAGGAGRWRWQHRRRSEPAQTAHKAQTSASFDTLTGCARRGSVTSSPFPEQEVEDADANIAAGAKMSIQSADR